MSRFPTIDPFRIPFQPTDGVARPEAPLDEPGTWHDDTYHDLMTGCFPALLNVIDAELTGNDPSTGDWVVTVTPQETQQGGASADGLQAASITFTAAADSLADVVLGLIQASEDAATLLDPADLPDWERFYSYVQLSVSPTGAEHLRFTARNTGDTFLVEITAPAGNGSTQTVISTPDDTTLAVGCYAAIDRTQGANGYNEQGQPFLTLVSSTTPAADLIGPIWLGTNTEPLDQGDAYRVYAQGSDVPLVRFGHVRAAGTKGIPASSVETDVYVLHTETGTFPPGTVTDAAGAAEGATANVWTLTPVVVNSQEYQLQIEFGTETVVLTYLSDGTAADTEITAGMLAQLQAYNGAGGPLEGITGVDGATLVLTGPADGTSFTPSNITGDMGPVETTAGVTTHIQHPRDKFLARSPGIGSAPIRVPHPTA